MATITPNEANPETSLQETVDKDIYEDRYYSEEFLNEPLADLVSYPPDDIIIQTVPRFHRTSRPSLEGEASTLLPSVRECYEFYQSDWLTIRHQYSKYQRDESLPTLSALEPIVYPDSPVPAATTSNASSSTPSQLSMSLNPAVFSSQTSSPAVPDKPNPHNSKTLPRNTQPPQQPPPTVPAKKERPGSTATFKASAEAAPAEKEQNKHLPSAASKAYTVKESTLRSIAQSGSTESGLKPLDPHQVRLMEKCTHDTDLRNTIERSKDRLSIFRYYEPEYDWEPGTAAMLCNRNLKADNPNFFLKYNYSPFQFVINIKKLDLPFGYIEPFFASLTLYDLTTKKKISESYYFEDNELPANELIKLYREEGDTVSLAKNLLFTVQKPSDSIFLVFQLEKVLSGDIDAAIDSFMKVGTKKDASDKLQTKMQLDAKSFCQRLGPYRQPFTWSAVQVFENNKFVLDKVDSLKNFFVYGKEGIVDSIIEYNKSKKGKTLTGSLSFSSFEWNGNMGTNYTIHDPSLSLVSHFDYPSYLKKLEAEKDAPEDKDKEKPVLRELQEFPNTPYLCPHWSPVNNLFVYPNSLNFAGHNRKFRNIVVKMRLKDNDDAESNGLPVIYGRWSQPKFKSEVISQVYYHNRTPTFQDEFKIMHPLTLTPKHHLLFTFYHLVCDSKKKNKVAAEEKEIYAGYAFLPLFVDGRLNATSMGLAVNTNKLESGYLSGALKPSFLESGKPVFQLSFNVISTIYPSDPSLCDIFRAYNNNELKKNELEKVKSISNLVSVQYFPILCNLLLKAMSLENPKDTFDFFSAILALIFKTKQALKDDHNMHNSFLSFYSRNVFLDIHKMKEEGKGSDLHSLLIKDLFQYCALANTNKQTQQLDELEISGISWFLFDLIIRAFTLFIAKEDYKIPEGNRKNRMEDKQKMLEKLITSIINLIKDRRFSQNILLLNNSLSLFIRDLFSLHHRGSVIQFVELFCKNMAPGPGENVDTEQNLMVFRFSFLEILTDYEHYVPLNFPIAHPLNSDFLYSNFKIKHPLSSLVSEEVVNTLCTSVRPSTRLIAIYSLYFLFVKHDYDARYSDSSRRARIAQMYFVLLHRLVEDHARLAQWREKAELSEKRELLIGVVFILKNLDRALLRSWWKSFGASNPRLGILLELFNLIVNVFEFKSDLKPVRRTIVTRTMAASSLGNNANLLAQQKEKPFEAFTSQNALLSYEVNVLVLDLIEDFISDYLHDLRSTESTDLMDKVYAVLLNMLKKNHSEKFLSHFYATLRSFATKFPQQLFQLNNNYCANLIFEILRHCNSSSDIVRTEASVYFYLLLKHNQRAIGNFGRMRIQSITALSKFSLTDDVHLKNSFARLSQYAFHDFGVFQTPDDPCDNSESGSTYLRAKFARGVQDLSVTLSKILQDTIRAGIVQQHADYETRCDLLYQIAKGYTHTPDLRITWLKELSKVHIQEKNDAEAAFCFIHVAHLIADYLQTEKGLAIETQFFKSVSPSSAEFADPDAEGTCQTNDFNQKGMKENIKQAIRRLEPAEMYEYGAQLYKILIPLFEKDHNYRELSQAHLKLNEFWDQVYMTVAGGQRLFGTFFRVGFWGELFGDTDEKEYIYRMPKLFHLFELSQRLKDRYNALFGEDTVVVIQDSQPVDKNKLEKGKAYLQITHVEPYFPPDETISRQTEFEKNVNLAQFMFVTPFTKTGKAHGSIAEQCKRKTICCTDIPFPYMLTRLPVTRKYVVEISPIESSIETINQRVETLMSEVNKKPPNIKTLQQVLQGSVRLQVNAGAVEICRVFLGDANVVASYPREQVQGLCNALRGFLQACEKLLQLNKNLAPSDDPTQETFHHEMTTGYNELVGEMSVYLKKAEPDPTPDELATSAS